jgi:hypothetical protein
MKTQDALTAYSQLVRLTFRRLLRERQPWKYFDQAARAEGFSRAWSDAELLAWGEVFGAGKASLERFYEHSRKVEVVDVRRPEPAAPSDADWSQQLVEKGPPVLRGLRH